MTPRVRLAALGLALAGTVLGVIGAGRMAGLAVVRTSAAGEPSAGDSAGDDALRSRGLEVVERGYTLRLSAPTAPLGPGRLRFAVLSPDGRPVTSYEPTEQDELHMFLVQRDMTGYRHLHPVRDPAGTWTVPVELRAGPYRVFANFRPAGEPASLTLGADLMVSGMARPGLMPEPADNAVMGDYSVHLAGELTAGAVSRLGFSVRRGGLRLADPAAHLGSPGHLVALRVGDLACADIQPTGEDLTFDVRIPSPATYRLFLDFQQGNVVRTAEYTVVAERGP